MSFATSGVMPLPGWLLTDVHRPWRRANARKPNGIRRASAPGPWLRVRGGRWQDRDAGPARARRSRACPRLQSVAGFALPSTGTMPEGESRAMWSLHSFVWNFSCRSPKGIRIAQEYPLAHDQRSNSCCRYRVVRGSCPDLGKFAACWGLSRGRIAARVYQSTGACDYRRGDARNTSTSPMSSACLQTRSST